MTGRPSRIAIALLEHLGSDRDAMVGDLLEECTRRSVFWLWWQVLVAMTIAWFDRTDEIRPLRLVDLQPIDAVDRSRRMHLRVRSVNLSGSPLDSVGGLGLVALATLVTIGDGWSMLAALLVSMLGGVVLGAFLINRHRGNSGEEPLCRRHAIGTAGID